MIQFAYLSNAATAYLVEALRRVDLSGLLVDFEAALHALHPGRSPPSPPAGVSGIDGLSDPRKGITMSTNEHAPRPKFDTLFADPRHYRGDCRLMRTAIRRGWLNDAPQADRDALVTRFEQATRERRARDAGTLNLRALFAECDAALELGRADHDLRQRALRYAWAGELTERNTGRPRERWHVSDYPNRIDANELRRRAKAEGRDLSAMRSVEVLRLRAGGAPVDPACGGENIALAVVADARFGWRVYLVCPRCKRRRRHLYPVQAGVWCRECAGVAYAGVEK